MVCGRQKNFSLMGSTAGGGVVTMETDIPLEGTWQPLAIVELG